MKFSVNWLGEFVELPNDIAQLADLLTFAGVEIERIEKRGVNFDHVVVAQIKSSHPHPNADRLSVCEVDDGSGQLRHIVCGARNYRVGDKVPLARPGAVLPNELKIKASKLRGVESQGMLCSAKELALADESAGLLILPNDSKIGAPIGDVFPDDTILEVEITPNRADLLSHYGLAREIAALTQKPLREFEIQEPPTVENSSVRISAPNECPFYSARRVENLTVSDSPAWLRAKLEAVGLRPINNVVDVTNFVMLELGQPLHAFDADKVRGGIEVRRAQPNEKFRALDGRTYELGPQTVVIADAERAIGLGGVMGGEESGVTATTCNIILESAYFLPANIRRAARELNLPSDASYRFERGVDPQMVLRASARAAQLLREIAAGNPITEAVVAGTLPAAPAGFPLRYKFCARLLGADVSPNDCDRILESIGLEKLGGSEQQSTWKIPTYRPDLRREVDLVEEIARVYGIDRIPPTNRSSFVAVSAADRRYDFEAKLRARLIAQGFFEARTSALVARDSLGKGFAPAAVALRNPLSEDHVALRPSLIPGLLGALERNLRAGAKSVRLFELGVVFLPPDGRERRRVGLLIHGLTKSATSWRKETRALDVFDLKGVVDSLGWFVARFEKTSDPNFALAAKVVAREKAIGFFGRLPGGYANGALVAEIDLPNEDELDLTTPAQFHDLQRFPSVTRDIALYAAPSLTNAEILAAIEEAHEPLLGKVELFDLFIGAGTENASGQERKSLAYSLTYLDKNRTLTSEEVNAAHDRIRTRLRLSVGAELRE